MRNEIQIRDVITPQQPRKLWESWMKTKLKETKIQKKKRNKRKRQKQATRIKIKMGIKHQTQSTTDERKMKVAEAFRRGFFLAVVVVFCLGGPKVLFCVYSFNFISFFLLILIIRLLWILKWITLAFFCLLFLLTKYN